MYSYRSLLFLLLVSYFVGLEEAAAPNHGAQNLRGRAQDQKHWVTTWGSMPQLTEPANLPPEPFNESGRVFFDSTVRQTVQVSTEAEYIRLRISNAFGGSDLPITAVTVALPEPGENNGAGTSPIQKESLQTLTFSGSPNFTIPNGALAVSDPVEFSIEPGSVITVSLYLEEGQRTNEITSHPGSRTTSWFSSGNHVEAVDLNDPSTQKAEHWYFISAIEAWVSQESHAFVIVGDSITDGRGSDTNANNRWPDLLLKNIHEDNQTSGIAIVNQAAGGNRILADGLGPNVLSRIDRDVLAQSGVGYAMLFEGVNDIGTADTAMEVQQEVGDRIIAAYQQVARRVHTHGIPIFAATITPFMAPNATVQPYSDPARDETRQRVNEWIRTNEIFDAVIDFDGVVADPENPAQLNTKYNSGDFLHLNPTGFQAVADAFPLSLFEEFAGGVDSFS